MKNISHSIKLEDDMENPNSLDAYINEKFDGLTICKPLFYRFPIGIRFEIGCPEFHSKDKRYLESIYFRSITIFEFLFPIDTPIYLVINEHKEIKSKRKIKSLKTIKRYLNNKGLKNQVVMKKIPFVYEDDEVVTLRFCLECKVCDIDYQGLLHAIGHHELGIKPRIADEVYIINRQHDIVYHLYDDRGLDVISNNKENLKDAFIYFNEWVLNYDREKIDKIFA